MLNGARAIIFDCDGTLVDSAPLYAEAWAAGFGRAGGTMPEAWYRERSGLSEHVLMDNFELAHDLKLDRTLVVETVRQTFLERIGTLREVEAIAAIARAAHGVVPMAVASGGPRRSCIPRS